MWNPSTCACECDIWCKPGQYLDYEKCVCKNKLIGKIISECTNVINNDTYKKNNKKIWIIMILLLAFLLDYFQ